MTNILFNVADCLTVYIPQHEYNWFLLVEKVFALAIKP